MNINPTAKRILCFGDSYTWGYQPGTDHLRYPTDVRWPGVLQNRLGTGYEVIEEGLNSRTLSSEDPRPGKEGRNGSLYLVPCLDSHDPLDLVILMLGTNETKEEYNKSAESIAIYIFKGFVNVITNRKSQFSDKCPKVLLITPPIVDDTTEYARKRQYSTSKTKDVVSALKERAKVQGTYLLNSNDFIILGKDGVHFDKDSHKRLGEAICNFVKSTIFPTMPNLEANTNQFAL